MQSNPGIFSGLGGSERKVGLIVFLALVGATIEVILGNAPIRRDLDVFDWVADCVGIALGLMVVICAKRIFGVRAKDGQRQSTSVFHRLAAIREVPWCFSVDSSNSDCDQFLVSLSNRREARHPLDIIHSNNFENETFSADVRDCRHAICAQAFYDDQDKTSRRHAEDQEA